MLKPRGAPRIQAGFPMMSKALWILALALPLSSQSPPPPCGTAPHCIILTWNANGNLPGTTFNVHKALGACPAAGTDLTASFPPFALLDKGLGLTATTFVDTDGIDNGTTWSYYVTAVRIGGRESAPSNCAQAVIPVTWPAASVAATAK